MLFWHVKAKVLHTITKRASSAEKPFSFWFGAVQVQYTIYIFRDNLMRSSCEICLRPVSVCICSCISKIQNRIPIRVLQHPKEQKHPLGTVSIAQRGLQNIEVRTTPIRETELKDWVGESSLIFPSPHSLPLKSTKHHSLLILDATWPKARGMVHAIPFLQKLPSYHLVQPPKGRYRIRKAPNESTLSSLESIVYALEHIEESPGAYHILLQAMDILIAQQIRHIPDHIFLQNYGEPK